MEPHNYVGDYIGEVLLLEELPAHITPNGSKQRIFKCQCSCGNIYTARLTSVKKTQKCLKCKSKEKRSNITGERFGMLVVISMAEDYISPSGFRLSRCKCLCDCGNECVVNMNQLVTGNTKSCGCLRNTRGLLKDHVEFMQNYDYELNVDVDLSTLTTASHTKVWWKCPECQKRWQAVVSSQTGKKKHGCPYCAGLVAVEGKTDLASQYPDLLSEWDYEKNRDLKPNHITSRSGLKVWWICSECGFSWKQTIANRSYNKSGCPKCNKEKVNSFCEQAVYFYIKQAFPDSINSDTHIGMELDIFIPSIKKAIEYDGEAWHNSKRKSNLDLKKNEICHENGIELIRIREPKLPPIDNCTIFKRKDSISNITLDSVIIELLLYLSIYQFNVDTLRDTPLILEQFATKKYHNSLAYLFPEIAKEWHPTKNGMLTTDKVNKASGFMVWWLGKCGHEWQMSVADRTLTLMKNNGRIKKPYGCPYCSGKRVLAGFNDIATTNPELVKEWDYEKNGELLPTMVSKGCKKMVWWICQKHGYSWRASVNRRTSGRYECPFCYSGNHCKRVICIETGEVFPSASQAAKKYNRASSNISACCNGKVKTSGGLHWKYVDD